ncbi:MAG TPA: ABC transporter permease [Thermoanaerobaculia bacterium]|nr:ABC transporter permease [Thermoanaerobaculia bacterium]
MKTTRMFRHSVRTLGRYKLRSAFMMLGTFLGIASLTIVVSVGKGAERKMLATIRQLFGTSSILVMARGTQFMGGPRADAARLTMDDIAAIAAELPQIEVWDPQQAIPDEPVRRGDAATTARVLGQSERFQRAWDRGVTRGESFDASAVNASARVAMIGETVARRLFGAQDPIGGEVLIGSVPFRVIGVLQPFGTDLHGMDRDNEIVVPISTLMRRVMNVDTIAAAKLIVNDRASVAANAAELRKILRERHAIPAGRPDDFTLLTAVQIQKTLAKVRRVLFLYLPLVAGVVLLVGAIVAAALMLSAVSERVGEIGLRRAVGARAGDIRLQFLIETAITTLIGGAAGVIAGYAGAQMLATRFHLGEVFSWPAVLLGLALSIATGLLAGVVPARRAAALQPADALR